MKLDWRNYLRATRIPASGCRVELVTETFENELLDTTVTIKAEFVIDSGHRAEFCDELGKLVDRYRI